MEEKKNIDRLFQEKFKDFEVFPDPSVWENIENQLHQKKKRRLIPLWLRLGGVAAILFLAISSGLFFFNQEDANKSIPNERVITNTEEKTNDTDNTTRANEELLEEELINKMSPETLKQDEQLISTSSQKTSPSNIEETTLARKAALVAQQNTTKKDLTKPVVSQNNESIAATADSQNRATQNLPFKMVADSLAKALNTDATAIALEKKTLPQEESGKIDMQDEIEKKATKEAVTESTASRWSVGPAIAPVYFNTLSDGSPIDPSLAGNSKNSNVSMSYGIKFNYKISDKLTLQSGINNVELEYGTSNVTALLSTSLLDNTSTNINTNVEGVSVAAFSTTPFQSAETLSQRSSVDLNGSLDQSLNYIEVPIEAKYELSKKRLGIYVIGGLSTYVLNKNEVAITSFGKRTKLGEATNINSLNFSGNLGVDFDYNISKKLFINVSPMFKYQFNTFSENSGGFQPYYFGVYTGLNFRF